MGKHRAGIRIMIPYFQTSFAILDGHFIANHREGLLRTSPNKLQDQLPVLYMTAVMLSLQFNPTTQEAADSQFK